MFEGFETRRIEVAGSHVFARIGGNGPPLLLLHGYPQNHVMWHLVAPVMAERFTVICADLRGYGDSGKPPGDLEHQTYSKRASAGDLVQMMSRLGFSRFQVAGHDRGGRVAHRMALDHAGRVQRLAVLDIVPTRTLFRATNKALATGYYHWFFLIQPNGLPESMIGHDPIDYLHRKLTGWGTGGLSQFSPEAIAEYERCFADPAVIHASCEDYRAAASIDLDHDEADIADKIACPLLVLWGARALMHKSFDVLATWRERAGDVSGDALDCGHYLPEEKPAEVAAAFSEFFEA